MSFNEKCQFPQYSMRQEVKLKQEPTPNLYHLQSHGKKSRLELQPFVTNYQAVKTNTVETT